MSGLFVPLKHFKEAHFHRHTDRTIGWLELFYDLVYVATLIQIGNFLSDNVSVEGFGQFMVMLTVVWVSWSGATFYENRYVVDDLLHRILVFSQIFAVASLGLSISGAFGDLYVEFTLSYVIIRVLLIVMYIRAMRLHPASKDLAQGYSVGFGLGIFAWLGSLLLPPEIHWVGWLVGIAIELLTPLTPKLRRLQRQWQPDIHHMTERFGIFTIIVLGEAFVKILDDAQGTALGIDQFIFSTFGLIVTYCLWWLYFSDTAGQIIDFGAQFKPVAWIYGHLSLSASLVAFAVGAKKLYAETLSYPGEALTPKYRAMYTVAIAMYLIALAIIDYGIDNEETHANQITDES